MTQKNKSGEVQGKIMLDLDDIYRFANPFNDAFTYLHDQAGELKITLEDLRNAANVLNRG